MKKKKIIIVALIALAACGGGTYAYLHKAALLGKKQVAVQEQSYTVKKGDVRATIEGTAQLEPLEQQTIVAPKEGIIKVLNLTRNQTVKKGDLLLEITDADLDEKLDDAKLTLSEYEADLEDLLQQQASLKTIAPASGKLILSSGISEGSSVSKTTKIATIADPSALKVTLPFVQEEAQQIHEGDLVQLTIDGYMLTKSGTVSSVSKDVKSDSKGNRVVDITVRVENDGTLEEDQNVKGSVTVNGVKIESKGQAALQYETTVNVLAGVSGTIDKLFIKENRVVAKGELIATIVSDSLQKDIINKQNQIDKAKKSIADIESQIANLKVYAPFDGVFSTDFVDQKKNVLASYQIGTTVENGTSFGAVASLDTLQLPISVDELDLPKVQVGQKAEVKVDAYPEKTYEAEVIRVSSVGTTTNGVTTYTAILTLKNPGELRNSMTATANVLIQNVKDVLVVPVDMVNKKNGKYTVAVKKEDGTIEADREVKVGANNDTVIEITDGLKEGDVIVKQTSKPTKMTQEEADKARSQFQQNSNKSNTGGDDMGPGGPPPF